MAIFPKAKYRPVTGLEKDPPIIPIGVILHTRAGTGSSLFDYFNGPSGGVESHMYLTFDGRWEQYRDTTREADANLKGNSFVIDGKRYGFLSVETEGLASDEWTDVQLAEIKGFIAWASKLHGFPLRVCPAWDKAGIGYHTMFGAPGPWTPVAKSCPGPKRIAQFNTVIVPWLSNPTTEDDELTPEQSKQLNAIYQGLFYGSTANGTDYPPLLAIEAETQRRVTNAVAQVGAMKATLALVIRGGNLTAQEIQDAAKAGATDAIKELASDLLNGSK